MFGWNDSSKIKPVPYEYIRISSFPFGVALYVGSGFVYSGGNLQPRFWRRVKNGDCLIKQLKKARRS